MNRSTTESPRDRNPEQEYGRGRRRNPFPKIFALVLSAGVALLGAEFAVRHFFHDEIDTEILHSEAQRLTIGILIEPSPNPELHYTLKRGLLEEWVGVIVATSTVAPVRVSTFAPAPAQPAIRIALLGDSGSFGWRMDYDLNYPELFRVKLEKTLGAPVELRNYSVPGYNTIQERALFETEIASWKPDLVILHYDHNDSDPQRSAPPSYIPPEYGDNPLGSALVKFAMRRVRVARNQGSRIFAGDTGDTKSKIFRDWRYSGPLFERHLDELSRLGEILAEREIPCVAAVTSCKFDRSDAPLQSDHYKLLHEPVNRRLQEAGFAVCDLFVDYNDLMTRQQWTDTRPLWISPEDGHHGPEGHLLVADRLHDYIAGDAALRDRLAAAAQASGVPPLDTAENAAAAAYHEALLLLSRDQWQDAEPLLARAVSHRPRDIGAKFNLAHALMGQDQLERAAAVFEDIIRLKSDYLLARLNLGRVYHALKRPNEAIEQFAAVLSGSVSEHYQILAATGLGDANAYLADTLATSGNAAEAVNCARKAVKLYRLADKTEEAERMQKALEKFQAR